MPIPKNRFVNPICSQKLNPSSLNVLNPQNTMGNPETIKINPKISAFGFKVVNIFHHYLEN